MRLNRFTHYIAIIAFCLISLTPAFGVEVRIKPGNIIHITVLGYPELSQVVLVRQDGTTDYPMLANIPIDGMTVLSLHEMLQPLLVRFIERPKLFINIAEYRQINVSVEGQVNIPGVHTVSEPISLQGILSISGGTTGRADLRHITINRREMDSYREFTVDLYEFYADRENAVLPDIKDGDIIFIPVVSSETSVRIMGAVQSPGSYIPIGDENIADMINRAGGAKPKGKMNAVIYLEYKDGKHERRKINLKNLVNNGLTDQIPIVRPGDIIVVSEYLWYQEISWYVYLLRDISIVLSSLVIISNL
jgi:protein involved in polysaccharide export with SLBB domain